MSDIKENLVELLDNSFRTQDEKYRAVTAQYTAEDLIANGVTIQEWIPVEERLPKNGTVCLACTKHEDISVRLWDVGALLWIGEARGSDWGTDEVTHWMPLPEPPKGE